MRSYAIILASGSSRRFGGDLPKQFMKINGKTILEMTVEAFEQNEKITDIIVICNPDYIELCEKLLPVERFTKLRAISKGGETRQKSSYIGVSFVKENDAKVLIHDGARPFVSQKIIDDCVDGLDKFDALGVAISSNDTIIELDENGFISKIPQRSSLRRIQTPQAFKASVIKEAHEKAASDIELIVTDDCGMVLHYDLCKIAVIEGDEANIKITHKSDLA